MEESLKINEELKQYANSLSMILCQIQSGDYKGNASLKIFLDETYTRLIDIKVFSSSIEYQSDLLDDLINSYRFLLDEYFKQVQLPYYNLYDMIMSCSSHAAATYANNTFPIIRVRSKDRMMFSCQYHEEKTPSYAVSLGTNRSYCYGCGRSYNVISYMCEHEQIDYEKAQLILVKIYLIDTDNNPISDDDEIVLKYRNSLIDEYKQFLYENLDYLVEKGRIYMRRTRYGILPPEDIRNDLRIIEIKFSIVGGINIPYDRVQMARSLYDELNKVNRVQNNIHIDFTKEARKRKDKIMHLEYK